MAPELSITVVWRSLALNTHESRGGSEQDGTRASPQLRRKPRARGSEARPSFGVRGRAAQVRPRDQEYLRSQ
jgi:hypothetical protein